MGHPEFSFHILNERGKDNATKIARAFDTLLTELQTIDDAADTGNNARLRALVRTKLEEACFFVKKAVASDPRNQEEVR